MFSIYIVRFIHILGWKVSKSYFLSGYLFTKQNTPKWSAWQTYNTTYTHTIYVLANTPVITDITLNPFVLLTFSPFFFPLSQSFARNVSHIYISILFTFGAKQSGYYMDTLFFCSSNHFENNLASFFPSLYKVKKPLWIDYFDWKFNHTWMLTTNLQTFFRK